MKKRIKDITLSDMPKCWDKLYEISPAFAIIFTNDKDEFDYAKSTIPNDFLDMEIELEE